MIKIFKASIFLLLLLVIASCGDDGECLRDDYLGEWSGIASCEGEEADMISAIIRAGNAADEIIVDDGESEYILTVNGCKIDIESQNLNLLGFEIELEGDGELDGNTLIINQKTVFLGIAQECEVELTR
jgi:hypothetical protein